MMKYICLVLAILFLPVYACATQPENGWQPEVAVSGKPLTVSWEGSQNRPKVVSWMQTYQIPEPYYVSQGEDKIIIPRKGTNIIPSKLMIVPEDNSLKPVVIEVTQETENIQFIPEPIPQNEVWFWGFTPESKCSMYGDPHPMSISVRLIHKKSIYSKFSGAFVWKIALTKEDKYEIPFYFLPNIAEELKSVSAHGFTKANDISRAMCHAYHGGECKFTLETNNDVWGRSHQIIFKQEESFDSAKCPI